MSDTGHQAGKPPKYDVKGGRSFKMWTMKYKALMHNIEIGAVLSPGFGGILPAKEAIVLDLRQPSEKAQSVAKAINNKAVNGCVLAIATAEMMNKIIEEQAHSKDWPGRKFTRIWERIQEDEKPDDDMAEFELDE